MPIRTAAPRLPLISFFERRTRGQRIVVGALAASMLAWFAARRLAVVILDRWWFDSITDADVWRIRTIAQAQLLVGVSLVTALVLGASVWFTFRVAAVTEPSEVKIVRRYHERMGPGHRWLLIGLAVFFTLRIGLSSTRMWQVWLLFRNGRDLGVIAPVAGGDVGYHLFTLPFLTETSSFLRQLLVFTIGVVVFGHIASGALAQAASVRSRRLAMAHLATLIAGFCAIQALHLVFVQRRSIATNRVGTFDGPGWTERYISRPGLVVVAIAVAATGYGAIWFARTGRWRMFAGLAVSAAVIHVAVVIVAPVAAERFVVAPAEAERQLWSIDDNLVATRAAFGLTDVETVGLETGAPPIETRADVERTPLFSAAAMATSLQVLAGTRATRIVDVDINRYEVDGEIVPVLVGARSASRADVPESGWVQEHLVYTHGDGLVVAPANHTDDDGRPDVKVLRDEFGVDHVPLYFGESLDGWYAIVSTRREQMDGTEFVGEGIDMSSFGRRLVLSLAVGESQPVLSPELTAESQLLFRRSIRERVGALAPFLRLDGDPYPVVADGRVVWVIDGYTTSSTYPAAQFTNASGVSSQSDLAGTTFNYLHAAVKATVDAESGETHLYRTDDSDARGGADPILDTWSRVFPGLLEPISAIDESIVPYLRYPEDLWTVQSGLIGRYHVDTAEDLFNGTERWSVSAAAASSVGQSDVGAAPTLDLFVPFAENLDGFASVRPLGPGSSTNPTSTREELAAIAVAEHGLDGTIRLVVPSLGGASPLLSPQVAQSAIDADPELARTITLLNANGSTVAFGPIAPVLSGDQLVWLRPIIVTGTGAAAAPRLYAVAAVLDGDVAVEPTALEAVAAVAER